MEQKSSLRLIFKIHSRQLKKANWNLTLPFGDAMRDFPDIVVSISDSQAMRFIDEINGVSDANAQIRSIQRRIKAIKKKPQSRATKSEIRELYQRMYGLQFQKDYVCVIMDSNADYDRANQGFSINGTQYRRYLGTNGGIKHSTITYVSSEVYPELKRRLDNGRNMAMPLVPAKLEAYQALICSGSTPVPFPKGIIVVDDCITHFTEDVITINDEEAGEPVLEYTSNFEVEHTATDGCGLMLPSYSRQVNGFLTGDYEHTLAGMNTRYSWEKGMVFTFDFVEFAESVGGSYEIRDAWGDKRDVREAEVILTTSMLKLWDSYDSWESYHENCEKNHYQFSITKTTVDELENTRNTNYQFLQSYELNDEELYALCKPTLDEIHGVLGLDPRKSIVFSAGYGLDERTAMSDRYDYCSRALMAEPEMINDPFVRRKLYNMIKTRIDAAKRGSIKVNANFTMIAGDPYALAQSMFDLKITGLLGAGEIYHKYWSDRGAEEVSCFRAPMSVHNNIRKLKLKQSDECQHWYQYMNTVAILNAWDSTCDAMNGCDMDILTASPYKTR